MEMPSKAAEKLPEGIFRGFCVQPASSRYAFPQTALASRTLKPASLPRFFG
jgi:hypothetical protein